MTQEGTAGSEPSAAPTDPAGALWPHEFLRAPFAVLAGAGISLGPPSNIPSANALLATVLDNAVLPLATLERTALWSALTPGNTEHGDQYTFLRFEQVIEAMGQTVDPALTSLRAAFPPAEPNFYHHALARLIGDGAMVLTTNFDDLIETACTRVGLTPDVIVTELDYQEYRHDPGAFRYPLFKLHGSFGAVDADGAHREVITEAGLIGAGTVATPFKWRIVRDILDAHDLLVLGYSGYDDFDVVPAIARSGRRRRLYWSRYAHGTERVAHRGTSAPGVPPFPLTGALHDDWMFNYVFGGNIFAHRALTDVVVATENSETMVVRVLEGESDPPTPVSARVPRPGPTDPPREWPRPALAPNLAARLLQHTGQYDHASELLHEYLDGGPSDALAVGRAHLWLAAMAADRHRLNAVDCHIWTAMRLLGQTPLDDLRTGDITELLGFPFTRALRSWEMPWSGMSSETLAGLRQTGIDNRLSIPIWQLGWDCARSIRVCVQRGDLREAKLVADVFTGSPLYALQCEEVLADVSFWLAVAYAEESKLAQSRFEALSALNASAAHADRAARVFQRLQRRRKFIDALVVMGMAEASEGRDDWARSSAHEIREVANFTGSAYGLAGAIHILGLVGDPDGSEVAYQHLMQRDKAEDVPCCEPDGP